MELETVKILSVKQNLLMVVESATIGGQYVRKTGQAHSESVPGGRTCRRVNVWYCLHFAYYRQYLSKTSVL